MKRIKFFYRMLVSYIQECMRDPFLRKDCGIFDYYLCYKRAEKHRTRSDGSKADKNVESFYIVDWGNGFIGGYDKELEQVFNTPLRSVFDDLKRMGIGYVTIITPQELDDMRSE